MHHISSELRKIVIITILIATERATDFSVQISSKRNVFFECMADIAKIQFIDKAVASKTSS